MTLQYEDIFSAFLTKLTDYSFLEYDDSYIRSQMVSWLHNASSSPRLRAKFSLLVFNDEMDELEFTLKSPMGDSEDCEFVKDVFARGMVIAWLEPQVKSVLLTSQMVGSNTEKWYAQANHLSQLQSLLNDAKTELSKIIRDYGYLHNSYIKE